MADSENKLNKILQFEFTLKLSIREQYWISFSVSTQLHYKYLQTLKIRKIQLSVKNLFGVEPWSLSE